MKIKNKILTITKLLGLSKLFWFCYNFFQDTKPKEPNLNSFSGNFIDSRGEIIPLIEGLRDQLSPNWKAMFRPVSIKPSPSSHEEVLKRYRAWQLRIKELKSFLDIYSASLTGRDILEIGAHDGATAYALSDAGAKHVIGSDIAAYYINQKSNGVISTNSSLAENEKLNKKRNAYRQVLGDKIGKRVSFIEDNICSSKQPSDSVDMILSWEVLEHLTSPKTAFQEMYRLLKPGGIAFHEYNPFFSLYGGHSLCTLDFYWGHARLSDSDFERYLAEIRPKEKEVALSFYRKNLNRMTLSDLQYYATDAGFKKLAIVPWTQKKHLENITDSVLKDCKAIYPSAELIDLISPIVWVFYKRLMIQKEDRFRIDSLLLIIKTLQQEILIIQTSALVGT